MFEADKNSKEYVAICYKIYFLLKKKLDTPVSVTEMTIASKKRSLHSLKGPENFSHVTGTKVQLQEIKYCLEPSHDDDYLFGTILVLISGESAVLVTYLKKYFILPELFGMY